MDCSHLYFTINKNLYRGEKSMHNLVCLCLLVFLYIQRLKSQYGSDWQCQTLTEFSFTKGCDHVSIECEEYNFQGMSEVILLSNNKVVT